MSFLERIFGGHHKVGHGERKRHDHHDTDRRSHGTPTPNGSGNLTCARCGTAASIDSRFCPQCGSTLAPSTCVRCDGQLQSGARFCGQCGNAVT
ncbi:MAG: zinc ribbon domain-containing protein [Proteobacteria bacterium]|uniref:zinc ribbon domain-containing protein n=1 Tax=Pseudacidovorax intermedius TaxID=433924 RepID=UPI0009DB745A|nr:zinc ribbon domain-containing protein [Pseudomonadota bacterium]